MTSNFFEYNKMKTIQALRYHFISRKEIKVMMILVNVFAILSAVLFFYKKISPVAFLLSSMLWFIMMILFWFLLPRIIYRKSSSFKDRFKVSLNEEDFMLEHERASRSFNWKEFSSWMESPHFFHLYFNSRSFFLIPKEAFDQEEKARKIFKEKIRK
ncbi:MAG: YcxB family protein [Bacteroidota bacterium]